MRAAMTCQERRLWARLRGRQVGGHKFRRQAPIGTYIVDFVCLAMRVVVEVDGEVHEVRVVPDHARERALSAMGFSVLRFTGWEVQADLDSVVRRIAATLHGAERRRRLLDGCSDRQRSISR